MNKNNEFIILQSMYLNAQELCELLMKNQEFELTEDFLNKLSFKLQGNVSEDKQPIRKLKKSLGAWEFIGVMGDSIGVMILQKHNKLIKDLWDCWSDEELLELIEFNHELNIEKDMIRFKFPLDPIDNNFTIDSNKLNNIDILKKYGICNIRAENALGKVIVHVEIKRSALVKLAYQIIDDNPIDFIDINPSVFNINKLW